jgi:hypothetical protein
MSIKSLYLPLKRIIGFPGQYGFIYGDLSKDVSPFAVSG